MWAAIAAIVQAILGALFAALRVRRQDEELTAANKTVAVDEAVIKTDEAQDEIVDEVNKVEPASNRDDLIDRLQRDKAGPVSREASRKRRPF
jgi:hypothetical protein